MKQVSVLIFWLLFATLARAQDVQMQAARGSSSIKTASVQVDLTGSGGTIPTNFVGISGEVGDFVNGFYQGTSGQWTSNGFTGNAASYISLVNLLGSTGSFRLGGGSADTATAPTITAGMSTNLNSFLVALGANWKLIYGLDLVANDTTTAATTASNISTAVGVNNVVFQFGNEPSLNGFTSATYTARWNSYYTAVRASVATANTAAIDDEINLGWGNMPTVAAGLTPGVAGLSFISMHWYSFCNGTWTGFVPAIVLSSIRVNRYAGNVFGGANQGIGYLANNYALGSTGQRMSETNSICSRGQTGMSNAMVASAWFLNTAIVLASNGWLGMNVHTVWTGGMGIYNPVIITADNNFKAGTVFYGMYLFTKIQGQQIVPSAVGGGANVSAIATKGGGGNANIIVVNNDVTNAVVVTLNQSSAWSTASVLSISDSDGNGCASTVPVVGGASIGESGSWSGSSYTISNGKSLQLPPCGAALVQIQP